MKILFIENSFQKGGSFQSLKLIADLISQDHDVHIIYSFYQKEEINASLKYPFTIAEKNSYLNHLMSILLYKLNTFFYSPLIENMGAFFEKNIIGKYAADIKSIKPDVIVFNNTPYVDYLYIKSSTKYPARKICHLRLLNKKSIYNQTGFRKIVEKEIDAFIANSMAVKESWAGDWGIRTEKIEVIHNAVNPAQTDQINEHYKNLITINEKTKIGCIGRINSGKGQKFLVDTLLRFERELEDCCLFIIGDGPQKEELESIVKSSGNSDNIIFLGNIPNARNYMHLFDIIVLPSVNEPFGNVILESMQAEVPVISTDSGGPGEIITHGHDGMLVPYGDHQKLCEAMLLLKNDKVAYEKIRKNALLTFNQRFCRSRFIKRIKKVYTAINNQI